MLAFETRAASVLRCLVVWMLLHGGMLHAHWMQGNQMHITQHADSLLLYVTPESQWFASNPPESVRQHVQLRFQGVLLLPTFFDVVQAAGQTTVVMQVPLTPEQQAQLDQIELRVNLFAPNSNATMHVMATAQATSMGGKPYQNVLMLNADAPQGFVFAKPSMQFVELVKTGVLHIVLGFDHLLFLLVLILGVQGAVPLLQTTLAFTVGHSLTLLMSHYVSFPMAWVEVAIAASIVWVAYLNLFPMRLWLAQRWLWAALLGLVHGMGFANSLSSEGIDISHSLLSLFGFNLGVEIGQLAFVLPCAWLLARFKYHVQLNLLCIALGFWLLLDRVMLLI